jgi:hypothetical protein
MMKTMLGRAAALAWPGISVQSKARRIAVAKRARKGELKVMVYIPRILVGRESTRKM